MKKRCSWVTDDLLYIDYHDTQWGKPVYDDATLFEFLVLESFQAGLSWITILRKREHFRAAFDQFDYQKIADYDAVKKESLMQNAGIVRNRLKIAATIKNAALFQEIQGEYGAFSNYIWGFVGGSPIVNAFKTSSEVPATSDISDRISKDLKRRGFKFVGSTIIYAFMQATGMVNDHTTDCICY